MISVVLLFHLLLASGILLARRWVGRWAFPIAALGPVSTVALAVLSYAKATDGTPQTESVTWVPGLGLTLDFRLDGYAVLFLLVVGFAGIAIFLHAARYFSPGVRESTFAATMTLFAASMAGLVTADHLLTIFVFWELTTITSYLLIGYDDHLAKARSAALHAAIITGGGGLAMLGGLVILGNESGSFYLSDILANPLEPSATIGLAWVLILIGVITKSAQFPFHGWLPGAMAAPTPASAFLHSATMVKAGIFLAGRLAPAAVASTDWWQPAVLVIGFVTMFLGAWQALRQDDLKLLLAYGTVSQLGFLFVLIGFGSAPTLFGGLALLLAHAAFKAALFMVVGTIDHEAGTRDIRRLTGLRSSMRATFVTAAVAAASMAAIPLTFGFAAKESAFDGLLAGEDLTILAAALASALTVAYTGRFLIGAFGPGPDDAEPATATDPSRLSPLLVAPAALALVGLALGVFPGVAEPLVDAATIAVTGTGKASKLVLWPGFVPALGWSIGSLTLGLVLVWRRAWVGLVVDRARVAMRRVPDAAEVFGNSVRLLVATADRSTGLIQNGSLPAYLSTIILVAVVLPTTVAIRSGLKLEVPEIGHLNQLMVALLILGSALGLARVRGRFAAVILLGGVGYGVAGLFVMAGGPDLALTQLLVETLVIGFFALVFHHLPAEFSAPRKRRSRLLVSGLVALFVFGAGLAITAATPDPYVADTYLEAAVPQAEGRNVVNVILVDFRGLDTLGEISVLALATLGAVSLVLPVLRNRRGDP